MRRHQSLPRRWTLAVLAGILVLTVSLAPWLGARPAHAQSSCTWGDLICELREAGQSLIDQYLTPLKNWLLLKLNELIYGFIYATLHQVAASIWSIQKTTVSVGVAVGILTDWIYQGVFQPLITATNQMTSASFSAFFVIALAVLGCTYLLSSLIRLRVVKARNAILWFVTGLIFFQVGPSLYTAMYQFRRSINSYFYAASIGAIGSKDPFQQLAADDPAKSSGIYQMVTPCNNFPTYLTGGTSTTVNGLDIALAYLKADGLDVLAGGSTCLSGGDATDVPRLWYDDNGFFDQKKAPATWDDPALTLDQALDLMRSAVTIGFAGVSRLFQSGPIILFGVVEQLVSLCLTMALGLTFISFACAILFAFFERTEPIAWAVLDQWIELIVQSVVIALMQSVILALYISAANAASPLATLAVGVVALVLMGILLWSGVKAIWNSFNRLFQAFGQAAGGTIISTGQAVQAAVGTAATVGGAALTGGASLLGGASALAGGSTWAQAAGVTLGGSRALDGAAFSLARLPGLRDTALGEAANQFVEGSATRRVGTSLLGPLGGAVIGPALLTDRNPDHAEARLDDGGQVYWQPPMQRRGLGDSMNAALAGPTWEPGAVSAVGRGGSTLRDEDGQPIRRADVRYAAGNPAEGSGTGAVFVPAASNLGPIPVSLNNDGNLDETIRDDMKTDLAIAGAGQLDEEDSQEKRIDADLKQDLAATGGHQPGDLATVGRRLDASAGHLESAAGKAGDALTRSAEALGRSVQAADTQRKMEQVEGRLHVSGAGNIAEVLSQAIDSVRKQNAQTGQAGVDNPTLSKAMAGALDITPVERQGRTVPPVEREVPRFQVFADQALRMGLHGPEAATIIREVKNNPDGHLSTATRDRLVTQQHDERHESWQDSIQMVQQLEHAARILPNQMTAYGTRAVPIPAAPTSGANPVIFTAPQPPAGTGANPVIFTAPAASSTPPAGDMRAGASTAGASSVSNAQPKRSKSDA